MSKKLIYIVLGMFVVGLSSVTFGGQILFTDNGADHYYSNSANWQTWPIPLSETPLFNSDGTVCIVDGDFGPYSSIIMSKFGPQGNVVQFDNTLSTGWMNIGRQNSGGCDAVYQIYGGTLSCSGDLEVPNVLDTVSGFGKGTLLVMGGLVETPNLRIEETTDYAHIEGLVDVRGGKIVTAGDDTGVLQPQIDAGLLVAYGGAPGASIVMDYDVTTPGHTTITATSGLSESPADKARGVSAGNVNLTWTTPADPNFAGLKKYVYFGEKADLNWSDLNDPSVEADFLADRHGWVADAGLPLVDADDTDNSVTVSVVSGKDYYWQVNYSINEPNVVFSYLFTFDTKNTPPVVDAGYNQYSFLVGGSRILTLDGSLVEDDGVPAPATAVWSVVSALTPYEDGPTAPIDPNDYSFVGGDNNQYNSQFEVLTAGTYILELDAFDGQLTAEFPDEVTLFVRDTACKAAQIYPDYVPLVGDTNGDCIVDLNDVADVAGTWLDDSSLVDTTEYIP